MDFDFAWPAEKPTPCSVGTKTCVIFVAYLFPLQPRPYVPDFGLRLPQFGDGKAMREGRGGRHARSQRVPPTRA